MFIPKPSGLQRALVLLPLEDQIVLQAVANLFASKLLDRRKKIEGRVVFSNLLNSPKDSIFFLKDWRQTYERFQRTCLRHFSSGLHWVTDLDFAAYYDTISHRLLLKRVAPRGGNQETWDTVSQWLRCWTKGNNSPAVDHGIPQGPVAADFLAECFLLPLDEALTRAGVKYVRYVDDIRLFGATRGEVERATVLLETIARDMGLILQGEKFAIRRPKSKRELFERMPSLPPPGASSGGGVAEMTAIEAEDLFASSIGGRPLVIQEKSRARYVLYRAPKSQKLLKWAITLFPRHLEHIDGFVAFFSNYSRSKPIERLCEEVLESETPYEYVRGELWHTLARVASHESSERMWPIARKELQQGSRSVVLRWGLTDFMLACHAKGYCEYSRRLLCQPNLVQALVVTSLPDTAFAKNRTAGKLLAAGGMEPGIVLAEQFLARGERLRDFGLNARELHPVVANTFKTLGLIKGYRRTAVDQVSSILSSRYGTANAPIWKSLLRENYGHALQILRHGDAMFSIGRSVWLQEQDSFNDLVLRALLSLLKEKGYPEGKGVIGRDGNLIDFGVLLDPNARFSRSHKDIADWLRVTHDRRNRLPGSHPLDKKTGKKSRFLAAWEQRDIHQGLLIAYEAIETLVKVLK